MEPEIENLSLEDNGLQFVDLEDNHPVEVYAHCLVGTLISDRQVKLNNLSNRMASIWRPGKKMIVTELEGGLILFRFYHAYDLKWVIDNSPWTYDNCLLPVQQLREGEDPADVNLHLVEFWVQLHNLPTMFFSEKVGEAIGNVIDSFVAYDPRNKKTFDRPYIQIRVRVYIRNPQK